ncbi:hypothetical protein VNO77_01789 [Canavalia gladiata]|uniref:Uncharacterized protein n=1 Tax=Canavalia gladiata TaxID=3824 RepID=A0AAN9R6M4_CANGL
MYLLYYIILFKQEMNALYRCVSIYFKLHHCQLSCMVYGIKFDLKLSSAFDIVAGTQLGYQLGFIFSRIKDSDVSIKESNIEATKGRKD